MTIFYINCILWYSKFKNIVVERSNPTESVRAFKEWARRYQINLLGIRASADDVYDNGLKQSQLIDISRIRSDVLAVSHSALMDLPDYFLATMKGKTIYFCENGGFNFTTMDGDTFELIPGFDKGIVIGYTNPSERRPLSYTRWAIHHEIGHIVDFVGIHGAYGENHPFLRQFRGEYKRIFIDTPHGDRMRTSEEPPGFLSGYATVDSQEDFTKCFQSYIDKHGPDAQNFRNRAHTDSLIREKYIFMKKLFRGVEYGLKRPS